MKLNKKFTPAILATAMAVGGLAAPGIASAEFTGSMSVANFYLWRGLDISAGAPEVSGSLDYSHESGLYAGIWASSEYQGTETDLYFGYAGEISGLSYDVSFWDYLYPSDNALTGPGSDLTDSNLTEAVVGLGYADVGLTVYFGNDSGVGSTIDYTYTTLDYTIGQFNILYGKWSYDNVQGIDDSHLTVGYSPADNFTFTVSVGFQDDPAVSNYDTDPLFHVAYSLPVDFN
jgi:uncharacterized protein (TIGR02001 family)